MATLSSDLKDYLSSSSSRSDRHNSQSNFLSFDGLRTPRIAAGWFGSDDREPLVDQTGDGSDEGGGAFNWFGGQTSSSSSDAGDFLPSLSKKQRIIGFFTCVLMGAICLGLASLYIPLLVLKARKFALLYSLGSLFLVSSFSMLWGPVNHIRHLFSMGRLPFTVAYFGSMFATLYFATVVRSTPLTVICAAAQIFALVWYITSYVPGGQTGLKFLSKIFSAAVTRTVTKTMPV